MCTNSGSTLVALNAGVVLATCWDLSTVSARGPGACLLPAAKAHKGIWPDLMSLCGLHNSQVSALLGTEEEALLVGNCDS